MFTLVKMGGTLLSIDNFLFTLFYTVILNITFNFQFFSMHCWADDASRVRRMLDENKSSHVVLHFFSPKLNMSGTAQYQLFGPNIKIFALDQSEKKEFHESIATKTT